MVSKYSFYLALFLELTIVIVEKSEYIIQYEGWWFRITFLLFGLSMITTKRDLKQWIWFVVFVLGGSERTVRESRSRTDLRLPGQQDEMKS